MVGHFRRLISFPPAVAAMYKLFEKKVLCGDERAALSSGLYTMFRSMAPTDEVSNSDVFEKCSRVGFGLLAEKSTSADIYTEQPYYKTFSLTDPLTLERLKIPVFLNGVAYSFEEIKKRIKGGTQYAPGSKFENIIASDLKRDSALDLLLLAHPHTLGDVQVWDDSMTKESLREVCFGLYGAKNSMLQTKTGITSNEDDDAATETKSMSADDKCALCDSALDSSCIQGECGHCFCKCGVPWIVKQKTCPACTTPFFFKNQSRTTSLEEDLNAPVVQGLNAKDDDDFDDDDDDDAVTQKRMCPTNSALWLALQQEPSLAYRVLDLLPMSLAQRFLEKKFPIKQLQQHMAAVVASPLSAVEMDASIFLTTRQQPRSTEWDHYQDITSRVEFLKVFTPMSLGNAQDGALTINNKGELVCFERHAGPSGGGTKLFDPLTGKSIGFDRTTLAREVNAMMEAGKISVAMSEAFVSKVPTEAVMICVDISQSMESLGFQDPDKEDDDELPPTRETWDSDDEFGGRQTDEQEEEEKKIYFAADKSTTSTASTTSSMFVFTPPTSGPLRAGSFDFGGDSETSSSSSSGGETKGATEEGAGAREGEKKKNSDHHDHHDGIITTGSDNFFTLFGEVAEAGRPSDVVMAEAIRCHESGNFWLAICKLSQVITSISDQSQKEKAVLTLALWVHGFIEHQKKLRYSHEMRRLEQMSTRDLKHFIGRRCGKQTLLGMTNKNELVSKAHQCMLMMQPLSENQVQVVERCNDELISVAEKSDASDVEKNINFKCSAAMLMLDLQRPREAMMRLEAAEQLSSSLRRPRDDSSTSASAASSNRRKLVLLPKAVRELRALTDQLKTEAKILTKLLARAERKELRKLELERLLISVSSLPMFDSLCAVYRKVTKDLTTTTSTPTTSKKKLLKNIQDAFILEITSLLVDERDPKNDYCSKPRSEDHRDNLLKIPRQLLSRTGIKLFFDLLKNGGNIFEEVNDLDGEFGKNAPEAYICAISCTLMAQPVTASDGHTYEKASIERWLQSNSRSPMTNEMLSNKNLTPNYNLKSQISEWLEEHPTGNDERVEAGVENEKKADDEEEEVEGDMVVVPIDEHEIQQDSQHMQIFVKSHIGGETKTLNVSATSTVAQVAELYWRRLGITSPSGQNLILRTGIKSFRCDGENSSATKTLQSLHVRKETTLTASLSRKNMGQASSSSVQSLVLCCEKYSVRDVATFLPRDLTIYEVKLRYWVHQAASGSERWIKFRPSNFTLWSNMHDIGDGWQSGSVLDNDARIYRCVS